MEIRRRRAFRTWTWKYFCKTDLATSEKLSTNSSTLDIIKELLVWMFPLCHRSCSYKDNLQIFWNILSKMLGQNLNSCFFVVVVCFVLNIPLLFEFCPWQFMWLLFIFVLQYICNLSISSIGCFGVINIGMYGTSGIIPSDGLCRFSPGTTKHERCWLGLWGKKHDTMLLWFLYHILPSFNSPL